MKAGTRARLASLAAMALAGLMALAGQAVSSTFVPEVILEPWRSFILADPLMCLTEGAVFQPYDSERWVVLGVGTCATKSGDPDDRMRCLRVAQSRAMRALVKAINGAAFESWIEATTRFSSKDFSYVGQEVVQWDTDTFETIRATAAGLVEGLPIVGAWTSPDGKLLCVAIGEMRPN